MERVEVLQWTGEGPARKFGWHEIAAEEALMRADQQPRCPICKGRVRLHAASTDGKMAAHAEHIRASSKCPLSEASKLNYGGNH